jgi:hypothetical protein
MDAEALREHGVQARRTPAFVARALAAVAALVAVALLTARVALVYPVSSDDATGVLEAASVLRGNLLLSGWTVSNISFVTTDLPYYIVGVAIRGLNPSLLREVPSAIYAVAVCMAVILASTGSRRPGLAALTGLVFLALPAGGLAEFMTKGYTRVGTSIGLFAALLALEGPPGVRVRPARTGAYMLAMGLTLLSDTFTMVIAVIAVLTVCGLGIARKESYQNLGLGRLAGATLLAVVLAQLGSALVRALGGFRTAPLPLSEYLDHGDPVRMLASNAWALMVNLPSLYRCDMPLGVDPLEWLIWLGCFLGPLLLAYAIWWGCPLRRRRLRSDFAGDVLWVSMALGLAAFMASANQKDRGTLRYMVPFVLTGAVLTGRVVAARAKAFGPVTVILGGIALTYAGTLVQDLRKPIASDPPIPLAKWLTERGLRQGYGPYWDASIVTASGRGRVAVRPVRGRDLRSGVRVIEPFRWMSNRAWYTADPANFVVFKLDPAPKYGFKINEFTCAACFGTPTEKHVVGPYIVLVWDHDLRPFLTHDLPWVP